MKRWLFTFAAAVSLVLSASAAALWVHGRGRAEGWYFKPSPEFVLQPPDPGQPSRWWVQWQINWGDDGELSINRQMKPVDPRRGLRLGFFSVAMRSARWNPLPLRQPMGDPSIAAMAIYSRPGQPTFISVKRTKPFRAWSLLGIRYISHAQEFGQYPPPAGTYFSAEGLLALSVPLLYLFLVFAILPAIWCWRLYRSFRRREGRCRSCGYDLTGNVSGTCPECGTAVPGKAGVKA